MSKHDQLVIDPEFKLLLILLSVQEYALLEQSLLKYGCLHPLIAWRENGKLILLDGHNRLEICQKHGIKFRVEVIDLPSREAAKLWIEEHQAARRNLSDQAKATVNCKYE